MKYLHEVFNALNGPLAQRAWVVFSGQTDCRWLNILRPGFRHCFIILNDGRRWFSLDPLLNHTELQVYHHVPANFDLPEWLAKRGQKVIEAPMDRLQKKPAPVMVYTCVEAVKRVLGLHRRLIFTPWQLYSYLTKIKFNQQEYPQGELSWEV